MRLRPRYDSSPILIIPGVADEPLVPTVRQRRRMEATLSNLTSDQWLTQSRCSEWAVRDVVVHLIGVNQFWAGSIQAGLAGTPTRFLENFDPAATPLLMVSALQELSVEETLQRFIASNDGLIATLRALSASDWNSAAEAPPGHIPIRLVAMHALWDAWIHERDIAIPLDIACAIENDEVEMCLRYAATLSPALALGYGLATAGIFAVSGTDPDVAFELRVDESVILHDGLGNDDSVPTLNGGSVELIEALSLRAPLPEPTPQPWRTLLNGLATAFDSGTAI
jgi:uncharacterized protein (TIGR03083 family)